MLHKGILFLGLCFAFLLGNAKKGFSQTEEKLDTTHLSHTEIVGEKINPSETSTQALSTLQNRNLQRTQGKSLGEALKEIAGVNSLQTGNTISKPVIHGLHSNRVLILNNGIRQEGQNWGAEHAPEIDAMLATRLTVVKGANAVRYGADAMGGVVLVEPPLLPKNRLFGGQMNLIGMTNGRGGVASGYIESKFHKNWAGRVQGTYKKLGDAQSANYILSNTAMQELNFSSNIGFYKDNFEVEAFYSRFQTNLGIMRASHLGNLSDLAEAIDRQIPQMTGDFSYNIRNPRQYITHNLLKINSKYKTANFGEFSLQYAFQNNDRKEFDVRVQVSSDIPTLDLYLQTHTFDIFWEKNYMNIWQTNVGINFISQFNTYNASTGIRPLVPQYENQGFGAFFIQRLVKKYYELELGIRHERRFLDVKRFDLQNKLQSPSFSFQNTALTLGFLYHLPKISHFRANISTAWRPPNVAELFSEGLHQGSGVIEEGNQALISEKAYKFIFSYQKNHLKNTIFSTQIDIHWQYIYDYIFSKPTKVRTTIRGTFPVLGYSQTDALFYGLDLAFRYDFLKNVAKNNLKNLYLQGKASLLWAENKGEIGGKYLIFIPANRAELSANYEVPESNFFGKKNLKNLNFQVGLSYIFTQNRSPKVISVQTLTQETNQQLNNEIFDFVAPPPAYFLMFADVSAEFPFGKNEKQSISIGIKGENLANVAYRDYMNRFRYYADDIGRNITLRLQVNF